MVRYCQTVASCCYWFCQ